MLRIRRITTVVLLAVVSLLSPSQSHAYSILTHLQLVDLLWSSDTVPFIKARFPTTDLVLAREYAYGGALLPDAGYYPRAVPYVSDYTHYVRSGDFITNLFKNATDGYELALALALSPITPEISKVIALQPIRQWPPCSKISSPQPRPLRTKWTRMLIEKLS